MDYDVIIVGAGAAGLMAAITAAERGRRVLLLEKMDQAGRKLRITGKGRCNLTNTNTLRDTLPHIGSDSRWIRNAYGRFFNRELMDFFEQRGVALTVERGNRVYPSSGKALDIFLALINELESNPNVTIRKNCTVKSVGTRRAVSASDNETPAAPTEVSEVVLQNGERIPCRHIVLAPEASPTPPPAPQAPATAWPKNWDTPSWRQFPPWCPSNARRRFPTSW